MIKQVKLLSLLSTALLLVTACSGGTERSTEYAESATSSSTDTTLVADSTIYALACDGCNDTVLIFLRTPYRDSDPDTLNVLEASRQGHIYGLVHIGDKLAIIRNAEDTTVADMVVSTDALQGQWCYRVLPTLRERPDGSHLQLTERLRTQLEEEREYSLIIKPDSVVFSRGFGGGPRTSDEEKDVIYPKPRRYRQWSMYNGQLLLAEVQLDSVGTMKALTIDTASFVQLTADTLVLRFADGDHTYYRKTDEAED